ncbi:MAG: hypothetical protein IJF37_02695 [Lachnospiraceae bacterium]|nr:hypothetical protein [Lachnospiraceae bacterium]
MRKDFDSKDNIDNENIDDILDEMVNNSGSDLKEWDLSDDEDIHEFLSRDFDVVAESRRRLNHNQNKNQKGKNDKRAQRQKNAKEKKEKQPKSGNSSAFVDKLKQLYSKWLEVYDKNAMQILFSALICLVVLLVIAIVATYPYDNKDSGDKQKTSAPVEEQTSAGELETTTEKPTIIPEAEDSDIHSLIVGYIDAAYIKADMEAVALVVDDTTNINVEKYKSRQKYIELYENIECYKLESAIENAYIVFVTYEAKLYNIQTLAPSAETFIVKYDSVNNRYIIHNITVGEKIDSYIAGASKIELISEKKAEVESRLNTALSQDAELKKVYDIMISTGSQTSEEATVDTSSSETTGGSEETTTAAPQ